MIHRLSNRRWISSKVFSRELWRQRLWAVIIAAALIGTWTQWAKSHPKGSGLMAADASRAPGTLSTAAEIQTARSLGKAYYEQGRYQEAVAEFKKVVASGRAAALDHLALGQALIQTNKLDEALEELNTARQMAPDNLSVHYNLGILYKHELHYPQAEAELRRVIASDPNDPPTWFNLGTVLFAERKLEPALQAFERVVNMGYAQAQNFYVAATFHCFIILSRLKQPTEAQKYLKLNTSTRDKVPGVSLQYPALEAGKYGEVNLAAAPLTPAVVQLSKELVFQNITAKLGIRLTPSPRPTGNSPVPVPDFLTSFVTMGDYNGDGLPDIYLEDGGTTESANHLLRNNGNGEFTDVTAQAGLRGPKGTVAAEFVDYDNSGRPGLVMAGLGGLTLYRNNGNGTFTDVTKKAGLKDDPCELDSDVKAVDIDNDGFLDLVVTAYFNACQPQSSSRPPSSPDGFPVMVS